MGKFATRVVGPVSKLVNPQHGSPYTNGAPPHREKKGNVNNKMEGEAK
jgi:hypothetical protein